MPRKSSAALAVPPVDGAPPRLEPPLSLSASEKKIFIDLVSSVDRKHFRPSDAPLLCRYVEAHALADQAAQALHRDGAVVGGKPSPWISVQEKAVRSAVALSLRLRLAPQSRLHAKSAARLSVPAQRRPWD